MENAPYLLQMIDIYKEFPGVNALQGAQLNVRKGEVHGLLGENGAGKSTMMNCLMGIYKPTSGRIVLDGQEISHYTPAEALKYGIAMIQQELSPVMERSIMSNVWLGREPKKKTGLIDWNKMYDDTKKVLDVIELADDPKVLMGSLTLAKMQMVEIARAVSYNSKIIIMDEPTSALTDKETQQLFKIIRKLKEDGKSIIYISHRLDEIKTITDRISVFRDGKFVGDSDTEKITQDEMIKMMVGRTITEMFPKTKRPIGNVYLEVKGLTSEKCFKDVSFTVRRGEIFGLLGLVGAGRTEVVETIFGVREKNSGEVYLDGQLMHIKNSSDAINQGMAFITEDRRGNGIFSVQDILFNTTIANVRKYVKKTGLLNQKQMSVDCGNYIDLIKIRTPSQQQIISYLSGGNQQKVLVARWLLTQPEIIIMDEPTRGIDVSAKSEIHRMIDELAGQGKSIIMISSELPEIMGMSDRIMVMHEGKVTGIIENSDTVNQELLLEYASGVRDDYRQVNLN